MMMAIFSVSVGCLYPAYASFKAIKSNKRERISTWLKYWLPLYEQMKICVLLWLVNPSAQGSTIVYQNFLHPFLSKNEKDIDTKIADASKIVREKGAHVRNAGISMLQQPIEEMLRSRSRFDRSPKIYEMSDDD